MEEKTDVVYVLNSPPSVSEDWFMGKEKITGWLVPAFRWKSKGSSFLIWYLNLSSCHVMFPFAVLASTLGGQTRKKLELEMCFYDNVYKQEAPRAWVGNCDWLLLMAVFLDQGGGLGADRSDTRGGKHRLLNITPLFPAAWRNCFTTRWRQSTNATNVQVQPASPREIKFELLKKETEIC